MTLSYASVGNVSYGTSMEHQQVVTVTRIVIEIRKQVNREDLLQWLPPNKRKV